MSNKRIFKGHRRPILFILLGLSVPILFYFYDYLSMQDYPFYIAEVLGIFMAVLPFGIGIMLLPSTLELIVDNHGIRFVFADMTKPKTESRVKVNLRYYQIVAIETDDLNNILIETEYRTYRLACHQMYELFENRKFETDAKKIELAIKSFTNKDTSPDKRKLALVDTEIRELRQHPKFWYVIIVLTLFFSFALYGLFFKN